MSPRFADLHLALRASWPPVWRRRIAPDLEAWFSGGSSTRHNAVVAGPTVSTEGLARAANDAAALYRSYGLVPRVEVRPWDDLPTLAGLLEPGDRDRIDVLELPARSPEGSPRQARVVWEPGPSQAWLELAATGLPAARLAAILADVPGQQRFLRLEDDQAARTVAVLRLVRLPGGWGMFNLVVEPASRGHGLGAQAVAIAMGDTGGRPCFLQVDDDNEPAQRLYSRFGAVRRYAFAVWDLGSAAVGQTTTSAP